MVGLFIGGRLGIGLLGIGWQVAGCFVLFCFFVFSYRGSHSVVQAGIELTVVPFCSLLSNWRYKHQTMHHGSIYFRDKISPCNPY